MRKFTAAEREKIRMQETNKAKVPRVGLFFVVGGKPWVHGVPWTEVLSHAGFRTCALGHPDYWRRLLEANAVPRGLEYEDAPRGRVNYHDGSGRFTLFADRCIIKSKRLVTRIMRKLCLPKDTNVDTDSHYCCARCTGKKPTRKQEREDWDF